MEELKNNANAELKLLISITGNASLYPMDFIIEAINAERKYSSRLPKKY